MNQGGQEGESGHGRPPPPGHLARFWASWAGLAAGDVARRWGKRGSTGGVSRRTRALPTADRRRWSLESGLERVDVHMDSFPGLVGSLAVRVAIRVVDPTIGSGRRSRRHDGKGTGPATEYAPSLEQMYTCGQLEPVSYACNCWGFWRLRRAGLPVRRSPAWKTCPSTRTPAAA